jgi:hypothetical protein
MSAYGMGKGVTLTGPVERPEIVSHICGSRYPSTMAFLLDLTAEGLVEIDRTARNPIDRKSIKKGGFYLLSESLITSWIFCIRERTSALSSATKVRTSLTKARKIRYPMPGLCIVPHQKRQQNWCFCFLANRVRTILG